MTLKGKHSIHVFLQEKNAAVDMAKLGLGLIFLSEVFRAKEKKRLEELSCFIHAISAHVCIASFVDCSQYSTGSYNYKDQ